MNAKNVRRNVPRREVIMSFVLEPDPGVIPTKAAPAAGDAICFEVRGLPPYKDLHRSIRNIGHRHYERFVALRREALKAMDGRCWYSGPVVVDVHLVGPDFERPIFEYVSGIMDTIDGSHGPTFTYLPIIIQDDCQVWSSSVSCEQGAEHRYSVTVRFSEAERIGRAAPRSQAPAHFV